MATILQVQWVDQSDHPDASQRIRHIGGESRECKWKHTREQAIQFLEQGVFDYHVKSGQNALKLEVGVAPNGRKYLKTKTDGGEPEILLSQPGFPTRS